MSQSYNNVDRIKHCNILFLVCILVFLDLSTLDISWNALFANAILRFTSFSHLQSAVSSLPKQTICLSVL